MEVSFLGLEHGDGLLRLLVLCLLRCVVALHVFFGTGNVFSKRRADVSGLLGEVLFELLLLVAEGADLSMVETKFFGEGLASLLESVDLPLQRGVVLVVSACASSCCTHLHSHLFSDEGRKSKSR